MLTYKLCDWISADRLNWVWMSSNPNAIALLERNLDKVSWQLLSFNPNAIDLLEKDVDKVNWYNLSLNQRF